MINEVDINEQCGGGFVLNTVGTTVGITHTTVSTPGGGGLPRLFREMIDVKRFLTAG